MSNAEVFESFFRRADLDNDGRISGSEAVGFFQGAGLPQATLAKIWQFSDQGRTGFLSRSEFYNALKLVTVAQTGRDLTPELVKAALTGPAAAQIPPPRINTPTSVPNNFGRTAPSQAPQLTPQGSFGQQYSAQGATGQQSVPQGGYGGLPTQQFTPSQAPQPTASQGNYGRQYSAQGGNTQQSVPQGGYGGLPTQHFGSQGNNMAQMSQPQGRFSSVGNIPQGAPTMQQQPRPGLPAAGQGMVQSRSAGGLLGMDSSLLPPKSASLPSGAQLPSSMGLSTGSESQFHSVGGLPRPSAPGNASSMASSLPGASNAPGPQAGSGGLRSAPGSFSLGDLYAAAQPIRPAGSGLPPSKSKSTPELQGFGDSFRTDPVGPVAPSLPTSASSGMLSGVSQRSSAMSLTLGSGHVARPLSGSVPTPPWPRMTPTDVQRFTRVFSKVDTDHDGKITGEQARELFLGWQLPREVLKQVWNLSDQDGDSMLSVREFCTALYLMERFREGRPLPPSLPPGIHLDDPRGPDGQTASSQHSGFGGPTRQQPQGSMQQRGSAPGAGPVRPTLLTTPAGQMHLQGLTSAGGGASEASGNAARDPQAAFGEFNFMNQKRQPEKGGSMPRATDLNNSVNTVAELGKHIMGYKEKTEYYRTKLQEIVLFKSRCDNKLAEITERAAADKREVESLAKKFDEKYKAAAEVNAQLAVEDAKLRDAQEKKLELYDALVKMEHGGDPNALLQARSDRIATDLDKLRKALRDRAEILGVEVKQKVPKEMPFGWQPSIQEKAASWNEDWDKFDDEGFAVVQEYMDEMSEEPASTTSTAKPSAAANWATEGESVLDDDLLSATPDQKKMEVQESLSAPDPSPAGVASEATTEGSMSNGVGVPAGDKSTSKSQPDAKSGLSSTVTASKASERYANVADSQESDLFHGPTAASSPTNSSELGRGSFTADVSGGNGSLWGFGMNDDDADSNPGGSWGLQSNAPSTKTSLDVTSARVSTIFDKSTSSFGPGESFDLGSPQNSSIDGNSSPARAFKRNGNNQSHDFDSFGSFGSLAISKDSNKLSSLFGDGISPKAAAVPSLFGGSPDASKRESDGFPGSFLRFDSPRASAAGDDRSGNFLNRFESFSSVRTDGGARGSGFHSDDESDIFSGSGPFGAKTDGWKPF